MYILGINSVYHESSACLLHGGELIATAEEERFNRIKHGKQVRADNPDELPENAIAFCLAEAGITRGDIDHLALPADPVEMAAVRNDGRPSPWHDPGDQREFLTGVLGLPDTLRTAGFSGTPHWVPHHTAHAASAYFVSPHLAAAVLVVDALGDDAFSTRMYHGRGGSLSCLQSVRYPASIGYLWELISVYLGFGVYDAAKVMGLAAYGEPDRHRAVLDEMAWPTRDGGFDMDHGTLRFDEIMYYPPTADLDGLRAVLDVAPRDPEGELLDGHHDLAAALQERTDELVLHMANHLHDLTGSRALCLAGGVALNCVTNERTFHRSPYDELWVQPAAHDGGLALGAAVHVWNHVLGGERGAPMRHAYWGPCFDDEAIEAALEGHGLTYVRVNDLEAAVAELICAGHVVGLFQGAMELGPRALGNRSILADPRSEDMWDILNRKVKHREYFRPLAPSVLAEYVGEWFDVGTPTPAADYMLMAYRVRPDHQARIPAVVHVDGTSRVQVVRADTNPRFHGIISRFHERTGVPMVLNTSFNDQEPIICTPADAVETFTKTEIDRLAIGSFLVEKSPG